MIGLFVSEMILFLIAAVLGFAIGWRLYLMVAAERENEERRHVERLRGALSEAQVKRARIS